MPDADTERSEDVYRLSIGLENEDDEVSVEESEKWREVLRK